MNETVNDLVMIAGHFETTGSVASVQPYGNGNINDTFLVTIDSGKESRYILQRLNTHVFKQPELVVQNMCVVTKHIAKRLLDIEMDNGRCWEVPRVLFSRDGRDCWIDGDGSFWRAITFIEAGETFDTIQSSVHAEEVGFALGMFHRLVSDLPPESLSDTLKGFHITPHYLSHFDDILNRFSHDNSPEVKYCLHFIDGQRSRAYVLEEAKVGGILPLRIMHGDPKINNVLIDISTQQAVGMIDLDTVKPGLVHYDIGDCLRSACNPLGEEAENWEAVCFEPDLCQSIMQGYLLQARSFLSSTDYQYIFDAVRLIAFELGLRFFTDYLEGDVYFKARYDGHNLLRALVQFKLAEDIESQETAIQAIINDAR